MDTAATAIDDDDDDNNTYSYDTDTDLLHASGLIEQMEELTRDLIKKYKFSKISFSSKILFANKAIGSNSFFHIKPLALK